MGILPCGVGDREENAGKGHGAAFVNEVGGARALVVKRDKS